MPPIPGSTVALVVLAQLDRISRIFAPQQTEAWQDESSSTAMPILSAPLCLDVKPRVFLLLSAILKAGFKQYAALAKKAFNNSSQTARERDQILQVIYILIATVRLLKVHVYQLSRAQLPSSDFEFSPEDLAVLRSQVFELVTLGTQVGGKDFPAGTGLAAAVSLRKAGDVVPISVPGFARSSSVNTGSTVASAAEEVCTYSLCIHSMPALLG